VDEVSQTGWPCYEVFARPITDDAARTYVILGVPRGGTSMVAGVARLCGLMLGDDLPNTHEDFEFNLDALNRAGQEPLPAIRAAIERRNTDHLVWGWKYPRAAHYLDDVRSGLRDPRLILVLRDPVASAGRQVRRRGRDPMEVVRKHHQIQARNLDLVERWDVPSLLVSYERSIDRPTELVEQVAAFLGMPVPDDPDRIRRFVRPGTYQDV
jgi:pimeloyl-ACP methyl ester carboxylesterase